MPLSLTYCLNVQRLENLKMSIVYHGASISVKHICNTIPLDNPKAYIHIGLPYITWGLIMDPKIKKEIPIENFYWTRKKSHWK